MDNLWYRYRFLIVAAIVFLGFCLLVLQEAGADHQLIGYLAALLLGGSTGYLIDYLLRNRQPFLHLRHKTLNDRSKDHQERHNLRDAWLAALVARNRSVVLLARTETGRIVEATPSACQFYGYPIEQLTELYLDNLSIPPGEELSSGTAEAEDEAKQNPVCRHRLASGETRQVEVESEEIIIGGVSFTLSVVKEISTQKILKGIIPICAQCKKIRDGQGEWNEPEEYIQRRSEATFSHGFCSSCAERLYPSLFKTYKKQQGQALAADEPGLGKSCRL